MNSNYAERFAEVKEIVKRTMMFLFRSFLGELLPGEREEGEFCDTED